MLTLAEIIEAFAEDPTILADGENVISSVATGPGGLAKVTAFTNAVLTLAGHGQNAIVAIEGDLVPPVTVTAAAGATTTVTATPTPAC